MRFFIALLVLLNFRVASGAELVERIQTAAAAAQTIRMPFVQEKYLALFDETVTTPGVIEIDRAQQRLRWEFTDRAVFVLAAGTLHKWGADGREETGRDRDPNLTALRAQMEALISGDWSAVEKLFTITAATDAPVLTLTPQDGALARYVSRLVISFRADLSAPERLELEASGGDITVYRFLDPELNVALPAARFSGP